MSKRETSAFDELYSSTGNTAVSHVYLSSRQCQQVDRRAMDEFGMLGLVLMENAARGATDVLVSLLEPARHASASRGPVVVCCGGGNNGGDGLVMARHLDLRGYAVEVLLWADPGKLTPDAAANYAIILKSDIPLTVLGTDYDEHQLASSLGTASWVIDALLGTGARGEPRPPIDRVIDQLNDSGVPILAVDVPSGLDCDSGQPSLHTIRARATCTFVAAKQGFKQESAKPLIGKLHVLDIGAPRKLIEEVLAVAGRSSD